MSKHLNTFFMLVSSLASLSAMGQAKPHVLMISIDGMRPDYVTEADEHHLKIPNLRRFITEGTYSDGVVGVIPTITYPSHTTMVTGVWPAQHGIYSNTKFNPNNGQDEWYFQASGIKTETLWQAAKQAGLSTGSVSWPATVGMKWIDWNVAEYAQSEDIGGKEMAHSDNPPNLINQLNADIPPQFATGSDERKTGWTLGIILKYKPDFMTMHFDQMDHSQHEHGPFSPEAYEAIETIDKEMGQLIQAELALDPMATIIVVSDHGFIATDTVVNLPVFFVQNGLITPKSPEAQKGRRTVQSWDASVWAAGGSAAIVLRDANDKALYDKVYAVLKKAQADPALGIKAIELHDELVKKGADPEVSFFVSFKPGFRVGKKYVGNLTTPAPGTGGHGYLPDQELQVRSSFFAIGANVAQHKDLGVIDMRQIAPTVARMLGASLPAPQQPALAIKR